MYFLYVVERTSFVTALPFLPVSVSPGKNATFHCELHVREEDNPFCEGVTARVWERGGIKLTFMSVTDKGDIIVTDP